MDMKRFLALTQTRPETAAERRADAAMHAAGLAFAAVAAPAAVALAARQGDPASVAAVAVYAFGLLATFVASAAYNLLTASPRREALRRLDHGAIYLKIAGSYTPFAVAPLAAGPGPALLTAVWTAAALGFALKLLAPGRLEAVSVGLYLALGWAMVWVADDAARALAGATLALLLAAGALYTTGVGFFLWRALPFQTAIWHGFVLAGSACIFAAVLVETA
jgi:hemolysin III